MNYMDIALNEAYIALEQGEVPVGAVIVKDNKVIATSHNMKEQSKLATAHAEILAIEKASKYLDDWRLNGSEMYVTLEPCAMCASAIASARISKLYIGTFNRDMGACGTVLNIFDYELFNNNIDVNCCYDDKCNELIRKFFLKKREKV